MEYQDDNLVLLSFETDRDASNFLEWFNGPGWTQFTAYVKGVNSK